MRRLASVGDDTSRVTLPEIALTRALLAQVNLHALMARSMGARDVAIGVIDGGLEAWHPLLASPVRRLRGAGYEATEHGTFVAGVLGARRDSGALGICPACPIVSRPIFQGGDAPSRATLNDVAHAIRECVDAGVAVINLSVEAIGGRDARLVWEALDAAADRDIAVVAAGGNGGAVEGSPLLEHPWVLPVVACDGTGAPLATSTLNRAIGLRGLSAPGSNVTSLGLHGCLARMSGASVATPFVTGAFALLRSIVPRASARELVTALRSAERRRTLVPPRMDAVAALRRLEKEGPK